MPAADVAVVAGPEPGGSATPTASVTVTSLATGLAVQTSAMALDAARLALSPLVSDDRDVTLYPIHD